MLRIDLAPALYEIAYSATQNAVFVTSAGGLEKDSPPPSIYRLEPDTLAIQAKISLERSGLGLRLDDDNGLLYIGNALQASITTMDISNDEIIGIAQLAEKIKAPGFDGKETERYPHNLRELVLDHKNDRIFAPGIWLNDSALYVINRKTMATEKVIPGFGFGVAGVTLDDNAGKLYVSNMQGQILIVDTKKLTLEKTLEIEADQLLNLTIDRKKGRILATDHGADGPNMVREKYAKLPYTIRGDGNRVIVIDPASGVIEHSLYCGKNPVALLIDETRDRLYVTNRGSGTITAYDSRDYTLLKSFDMPAHPNSLTLDENSGAVFATIKNALSVDKNAAESVARISF